MSTLYKQIMAEALASKARKVALIKGINSLYSRGHSFIEIAHFMSDGVSPTDEAPPPVPPEIMKLLAEIICLFFITDGNIFEAPLFIFTYQLTHVGAYECEIRTMFRCLVDNKEQFWHVGELLLKSLVMSVKKKFFPAMADEDFRAKVLHETCEQFHHHVQKVFEAK